MSIRLAMLSAVVAAALCSDAEAGPTPTTAMQTAPTQTMPTQKVATQKVVAPKVVAQKVAMQNVSLRTSTTPTLPTQTLPVQKVVVPAVPVHPVQPVQKAAALPKPPVQKVWVQGVSVPMDNVTLVTFKTPVSTVYIGNPSIAQLTVIDARHVFVMGKRFGSTNLIALSADKKLIESDPITVSSRRAEAVTVFRGEDTFNYACTDFHCESRPVPGDPRAYFDNTEGPAGEHEDTANKGANAGGGSAGQQVH